MSVTIGDVKRITENLPADTVIGVLNHFGELIPMTLEPQIKRVLVIPNMLETVDAVVFEGVDIGEEPE